MYIIRMLMPIAIANSEVKYSLVIRSKHFLHRFPNSPDYRGYNDGYD